MAQLREILLSLYDNGADVIKRGDENGVTTVRLLRRLYKCIVHAHKFIHIAYIEGALDNLFFPSLFFNY